MMPMYNIIQQLLIGFIEFGSNQRTNGKRTEGIHHRKSSLGTVLASRKRKYIRPSLTLAIDINAAHLVYQRVDSSSQFFGVVAEDTYLLAMGGINNILYGFVDIFVR